MTVDVLDNSRKWKNLSLAKLIVEERKIIREDIVNCSFTRDRFVRTAKGKKRRTTHGVPKRFDYQFKYSKDSNYKSVDDMSNKELTFFFRKFSVSDIEELKSKVDLMVQLEQDFGKIGKSMKITGKASNRKHKNSEVVEALGGKSDLD